MATGTLHLQGRGCTLRSRLLVLVLAAAFALAASSSAAAYGWPVAPFDRQHPVRGFFGDPRIGGSHDGHGLSRTFHFGVDVSAPDGTPVYATLSGEVVIDRRHAEVVWIRGDDGVVFSYWHVVPAVRDGHRAVAYRTVVGWIARGWGHVHFAELRDGRYLNPLRPRAMGPYNDQTRPRIHTFGVERAGKPLGRMAVRGMVDLVVEAYDATPLDVPAPWTGKPVTPALVRWRLHGRGGPLGGWRTAFDVRTTLPPAEFEACYARWTRQNKARSRGRYRFLLASGWDSRSVPDGVYWLEALAVDTFGNTSRRRVRFVVANAQAGSIRPR